MVKNNSKGFFNAIKKAKRIVIISSLPVDGDSLGAGVAVKFWLEKIGKKTELLISKQPPTPPPSFIRFSENFKVVNTNRLDYQKYDLVLALDCSNPDQQLVDHKKYGKFILPTSLAIAAIDHHEGNEGYSRDMIWEKTSSTCELVYRYVYRKMKEYPRWVGTAILFGIMTDTGPFRWEVGWETLCVAQELKNAGADYDAIVNEIFFNYRKWEIRGVKYLLSKVKLKKPLGVSYMTVTNRDLKKMRVDEPKFRKIRTTYQAIFSRAIPEYPVDLIFTRFRNTGEVSISGRSNSNLKDVFDLSLLSEKLTGTKRGHPGASGFDMGGSLDEAKRKVFATVKEIQEEAKNG